MELRFVDIPFFFSAVLLNYLKCPRCEETYRRYERMKKSKKSLGT